MNNDLKKATHAVCYYSYFYGLRGWSDIMLADRMVEKEALAKVIEKALAETVAPPSAPTHGDGHEA